MTILTPGEEKIESKQLEELPEEINIDVDNLTNKTRRYISEIIPDNDFPPVPKEQNFVL